MRLLPLAFIFLSSVTALWAIKPLDVRKRHNVFPSQQFNKDRVPLEKNEVLLNQRFAKSEWNQGKMSPVGERSAPIAMEGSFQKELKDYPSFRRENSVISTDDRAYGVDDRNARLENWERRWDDKRAHTFDVDPIRGGLMGLNEYYLFTDQLSMQDINRYQFRRSHSGEPGLGKTRISSEVKE